MKISIQKKKGAAGKHTLRLCYYSGYTTGEDGKKKYHRKFEELGIWVYSSPRGEQQRQHNRDTNDLAETIRSKRVLEVKSGEFDLTDRSKKKGSFIVYFEGLVNKKAKSTSPSNHSIWVSTLKHLKAYNRGFDLNFDQVNDRWLEGFREYLLTEPLTKSKTRLSENTASSYFNKVRASLNNAVKDGIIRVSPTAKVKSIKPRQEKREYLTVDEVRALAATECRYDVLKNAFLFSCLTGMRWSDIHQLTWSMVSVFSEGRYRVVFNQEKTDGLQYLDLNPQAVELMGEPGQADERVFSGLRYSAYFNVALKQWVLKAGITKDITFHCARHTFAVMQLSHGTDIYTVSKLLGHTEIKTTQVYADILDEQRHQAMLKLPDIFSAAEKIPASSTLPDGNDDLVHWVKELTQDQKAVLKAALLEV